MKEFRSFAKNIAADHKQSAPAFPTIAEFEKQEVRREQNRKRKQHQQASFQHESQRLMEISPVDQEAKKREFSHKLAENQIRYKELQDKNERTKALIQKRDEIRRDKADKLLEQSALQADMFVQQKKMSQQYCTARGNFGNNQQPIKRINNFKRPSSQQKKLFHTRSPQRLSNSRNQAEQLNNVGSTADPESVNLDLKIQDKHIRKRTTLINRELHVLQEHETQLRLIEEANSVGSLNPNDIQQQTRKQSNFRIKRGGTAPYGQRPNLESANVSKSSTNVSGLNRFDRPPRAPVAKNHTSMNILNAGAARRATNIKNSRQSNSVGGLTHKSEIVPIGPRVRNTLQNPNGTDMTTEDYLKIAKQMEESKEPAKIANFGLNQSSYQEWKKQEEAKKQVNERDFMVEVDNAKRLITKYAREEKGAFELNLKRKGFWTSAQEKRSQRQAYKSDQDLYLKLESNFAIMPQYDDENQNVAQFGGAADSVTLSMEHGLNSTGQDQRMFSQEFSNLHGQKVQMMPQDEIRSENDLGFMTEVDAEFKHRGSGKESQQSDIIISTRHSEREPFNSHPQQQFDASQLEIEKAEFKQVIKEIISKEQSDQLGLEDRILSKMRKRNLSKGWNRPTGVKIAPLKILQNY